MNKNIKCKIVSCISFILVVFLTFPQTIYADDDTYLLAKDLTKSAVFENLSSGKKLNELNDGTRSTKYTIKEKVVIKISSDEAISSIYVQFNRPPQEWTLIANQKEMKHGRYGFMHEYVELSTPQTVIELTFPINTILCEIQLFSKGEVPTTVEKWQPPYIDADMLLLPTHADDEHIFFGGIMPYYAGELKKKVQVAYLTNHYGEWYRPHELLAGLWQVGITAYPIIPEQFNDYYSDSLEHAKTLYDTDAMLAYETMLLRRFRPEVVIGHDINGEYGHGVHMLNTDILMQALELSGDISKYPDSAEEFGAFDVPKTYLHLYDKNQLVMNVDIPLLAFDNKTAFEMAREGFAKHASQTKYFTVEKSGKYDCRKFGLYRSTVGEDIHHQDFFENIKEKPPIELVETTTSSKNDEVTSSDKTASSSVSSSNEQKKGISGSILVILGILITLLTIRITNRKKAIKR